MTGRLRKDRVLGLLVLVVAVLLAILVPNTLFVVTEMEQAAVVQFGKPVRAITKPGLYVRTPFIQKLHRFEKRLIAWDGFPDRMPTRDKKNIYVDAWARWRITDPMLFFRRRRTVEGGQKMLDDLVDSAVRDAVGRHDLIEVVRSSNRRLQYQSEELAKEHVAEAVRIESGRAEIEREIRLSVDKALEEANEGIEVVDVRIKRIGYVESVRRDVYERMKAERDRIATKFQSEAEEQESIILGDTAIEVAAIEGDALQQSERIRGEADAEAIRLYAGVLEGNPEFYSFLRKLEMLKSSVDRQTEVILTTDGELFSLMKEDTREQ